MAKQSEKAQKYVSSKIRKLIKEGYSDPKQRVAIALSMGREKGYDIPDKKKKQKKD